MANNANNNPQNEYTGEKNDKGEKHGSGTLRFNLKAHYTGQWINDKMEGNGEYVWGDGHKYTGQFKNNKQEGMGIYHWPTGGKYIGQWSEDRMNGLGTYTRNDGVIYIGKWLDDHQFGMGLKIIPERVCYGEERKMYRRRKYREVWSREKKLMYHREIKEYPEVFPVQQRGKFTDCIIFTIDEEEPFMLIKYMLPLIEKVKPSSPSLSTDSMQ